ncbi:MAG: gluconeogenesis factor YvcK family protein [Candidatus Paceibacterota bacterium]
MFGGSLLKSRKKIVCIGGGSAMPKAVLSELKKSQHHLAVISAVLDSGGSAGKLRNDYHTISFGDIRKAFIELADFPLDVKKCFTYRFSGGELDNHVVGNIILSGLYLSCGNYRDFFERINDFLDERHRILPATITDSHLHAILENNEEIMGETNIDIPKHNSDLRIKKIFLEPEAKVCPRTVKNIGEADVIIIGPGDLYSSLLQTLLISGLGEAVMKTKAKKIFICNLMTKRGESNTFNVKDFADEIERYLGGPVDHIIYNNAEPDSDRLAEHKEKHPELMEMVNVPDDLDAKKFIGDDLLEIDGPIIHNPRKLNKIILNII